MAQHLKWFQKKHVQIGTNQNLAQEFDMHSLTQLFLILVGGLVTISSSQSGVISELVSDPKTGKEYRCKIDGSKELVRCPDYVDTTYEIQTEVSRLYRDNDFDALEALYNRLRTGKERHRDGQWKLESFRKGIGDEFSIWQRWDLDLQILREWQKKSPTSFIAKYAEAIYWRAYAWQARGDGSSKTVSKEGYELFFERLGKSGQILTNLEPVAAEHADWFASMIRLAGEYGVERQQLMVVFTKGQKLFPEYHPIYFQMARFFETKWGGNAKQFDDFAKKSRDLTKSFEGDGMYARLYWTVDDSDGLPFSTVASIPNSKLILNGINGLVRKYPDSENNRSQLASVLCRTKDSGAYQKVRKELGGLVREMLFTNPKLDICDHRHSVNID
jgi:Domain of unknown function (DUF4034)